MQSNRALVQNGWETNVIIQMFPYGPSKNKKKIYIRKKKKDYPLGPKARVLISTGV